MAQMYKVRHDPAALDTFIANQGQTLIFSHHAGRFWKPFSCPGYSLYYFQFKDRLPDEQKVQTRRMVGGNGWKWLSRPDGYIDPIFDSRREFNSENFFWMSRMTGLLFSHEYANPRQIAYFENFLDNLTRALFSAGRVEWDSSNYWAYCFQPALVLYEFAPTPKIKRQARAILDWMIITMALHYTDGFLVGPDVRSKAEGYKPFAGSAWFYGYLYFAGNGFPSVTMEQAKANPQPNLAGFAVWSSYRPPQVAIDIARRNFSTPVEMHNAKPFYFLDNDNYRDWKGDTPRGRRFEFETLYIDRDYSLGSLATWRPDGANDNFYEQSLWRLAIRQDNGGAVQVFGNAGQMRESCGRCPYEEIGQSANVMMRLVKGADRLWVAIPAQAQVQVEGQAVFARLSPDVYAAWLPGGTTGLKEEQSMPPTTRPNRRSSPIRDTHAIYTWTCETEKLAGVVMEVGTRRDHGSFEKFVQAMRKLSPVSIAPDMMQFTSSSGRELKMQFEPLATYSLLDGTLINPAGVIPTVWADGRKIDFDTWDTYRVVSGEKIVEEPRGGCRMKAMANGQGMEIIIDPVTADVEYRKIEPRQR
jgi:hypothetical protein